MAKHRSLTGGPLSLCLGFSLLLATNAYGQAGPNWQLDAGATVTITGTDNVEPDQIERRSDLLTTTQFNVGLSRSTRATTTRLTGNLSWDAYARTTRLNGLRYNALALISSAFFDQRLSLDLRTNTEQQDTTSAGATSAVDRSIGSNQTQILNITAAPSFRTAVGDWALAEASYSFNSALFFPAETSPIEAPISDTIIHRGTALLSTGSRFPRFRLTGRATAEETQRGAGAQDSARRDIQADAEYQLYPRFRITANVGYEEIDEPTFAADLEDPFGTVGFRWSPSTRTQITFNGGYRYQGPNFSGRITYAFTEQLNLTINYAETIETQQRLALGNLGDIFFDPDGVPTNAQTGQEVAPGDLPFDLQDNAFQRDAVDLAISGILGRNRYRVSSRYEVRDTNGTISNSVSVNVDLSRELSPVSSLSLGGGFQETEQALSGSNLTWTGRAVYNYRLSETFNLSFRYGYVKRDSALNLSFRENVLRLSASKRF